MDILKWLSFIVLFSFSLSFSTDSYETTFEASTYQSAYTFEPTTDDSTSESTWDYLSTADDSNSESTFDYLSIFENSVVESSSDYQSALKEDALEKAFESSIKNLLYPPDDRNCPLHEHWEFCTGLCQRNCSNWSKALICPDICVQGCLCDWGFTRGPEGNCIPVSECPPIEEEKPMRINVQYKCQRNEHFSLCEGCQKNCSNYDEEISCEAICKPGCVCDDGFARGRSGKCIPTEQCRRPYMISSFQSGDEQFRQEQKLNRKLIEENSLNSFCRRNQHFSACNGLPICQKSCSNYNLPIVCPLICVPGCVCEKGYVIGPDGECIPFEECPYQTKSTLTQEVPEECSVNEYYDTCGSSCPRSCSNYQEVFPSCPDEQCVTGCFCLPGYVRGPGGNCIRPAECSEPSNNELKRSNSRISNLFFENAMEESTESTATVSNDIHPFTISPSEDKCPDELSCTKQCRFLGHLFGVCLGPKEEQCVCFM